MGVSIAYGMMALLRSGFWFWYYRLLAAMGFRAVSSTCLLRLPLFFLHPDYSRFFHPSVFLASDVLRLGIISSLWPQHIFDIDVFLFPALIRRRFFAQLFYLPFVEIAMQRPAHITSRSAS